MEELNRFSETHLGLPNCKPYFYVVVVDISATQEDLIGDFSRPYALPLILGKHDDLKTISCETLSKLLKGEFKGKQNAGESF